MIIFKLLNKCFIKDINSDVNLVILMLRLVSKFLFLKVSCKGILWIVVIFE